ncbi:MAG: tRNA lysidine(34) synthetase TilS [Bacteroidales bacterium]|nr:tRNA lysidine(34) synthetase TilS [Bacteroidales bacterium]MBR5054684.1 tRNA lysidine(34) synthetase TilS [Bacteroidales bacterium]
MKVLLAVSGGVDSMCMADMFSRAGGEYAVAHCNFHLRGAESDADAEFVQKWAEAHGVPFFRADFDTSAYASEHGISIEMAARELRYAWFARVAVEHGFDAVAVAHNANDNAETLILNLLRGTGLRGLRGIAAEAYLPPGRVKLLRPMLRMTREEIEAYAAEHGVEYRVDSTNADSGYKRNRIRNAVFPEFAQINPSFVRTLNADMERFAQADGIVEDYFREAEGKVLKGGKIVVPELLSLKHWKYVIFRLLEPYGFHADTLDAVVRLLENHASGEDGTFSGKRFLSPTYVLETTAGAMTVRERSETADMSGSVTVTGPGDYAFHGQTVRIEFLSREAGMPLKQPEGVLACDAAALPFPFLLRGWQPGDWMRPFGMEGRAKKLSDLFADRKMSLTDKESAIVIVPAGDTDGHVAAVAGVRMDEALRVREGSAKILRITIL